ncbi:MAG: ATP-binding protein [Gammaproteobacteria bacterium]|nr:ATP-binding protein [Gammaproteobacteria bacterium]
MIISIASGKGGTGKTMIAVSLAFSLSGATSKAVQLLDCDVEEPNAHIFVRPKISQKTPVSVLIPKIDKNRCNLCGRCAQICVYHALAVTTQEVLTFPELCHSCGACSYLCPQNAISEIEKKIGYIEKGDRDTLSFVHGKLNIGEMLAVPVIKAVKKYIDPFKINVVDSPPGTSCPVIETVHRSDFCVLVTEPTPFGLNDLILAIAAIRKLHIPFGVIINRCDLGNQETENYCQREKIPILLKIPFKKEIALAYSKGIPLIEAFPEYKPIFQRIYKLIENTKT